ncbi:hypothetical protein EVAR_94873_1 [Eumeta japonica]|uniref:Pre-C2HC domain-containing protein n=1 Tax=Eumeta variegata TaxID=151549 RepID=A0A4C1VAP7_EUMVA|nr:hypothetical protein EVAR_94873_1 [Eumeta japonica]
MYALEKERKLKIVIRGIPTNFPTDDIQTDLREQGFPVQSVHRLCRRDGSSLWPVLVVLPKTEDAKKISQNLHQVYGLSGIRIEASYKKSGPGQYHGHAIANCHVDPRCLKYRFLIEPKSARLSGTTAPSSNPWTNTHLPQPPGATSGLHWETNQRAPPMPPPASVTVGSSSFGDDIQTVMAVLRAVKRSEISDFARDIRACRNTEEKFSVLVR